MIYGGQEYDGQLVVGMCQGGFGLKGERFRPVADLVAK